MLVKPVKSVFDLGDKIRISPSIFSSRKFIIQPGDLSKFIVYGNALGNHESRFEGNLIKSAPLEESGGGVIYFGKDIIKTDLGVILRLMEVKSNHKSYAVFLAKSKRPFEDEYFIQMRIVTQFGLLSLFRVLSGARYNRFPGQELTISEVFWEFIKKEGKRWNMCKDFREVFGRDGDLTQGELAFGFMVENTYYGVYRIWSRVRLIIK